MKKFFIAKILENKKIAPEYYVLRFQLPGKKVKISPGQFFEIKINEGGDPFLRRPFGAHKIKKDSAEILYKVIGCATKALSNKKPGEALDILGPLGKGFAIINKKDAKKYKAIILGGGHGIAPLYAAAESLIKNNIETEVIIGGKDKSHIVSESDFKKIGAKVYLCTEDGSRGMKGTAADALKALIKEPDKKIKIYACGPKGMLEAISKVSSGKKIECEVSMEEYFGCGIGMCMGCVLKTKSGRKLICKDGPVFKAEEIIWE